MPQPTQQSFVAAQKYIVEPDGVVRAELPLHLLHQLDQLNDCRTGSAREFNPGVAEFV